MCNGPILDVFLEKNVGLLALLNEESRFPQATDESLSLKLHKTLGAKEGSIYHAPPNMGTSFSISHYAGDVRTIFGFWSKLISSIFLFYFRSNMMSLDFWIRIEITFHNL